MASAYPGGLDSFTNPASTDNLNTTGVLHDVQHSDLNNAVRAIEVELGTDPSGSAATVAARLVAGSVAYSAYTPAITAATTNPTLGTGGSVTGRYYADGKHIEGDIVVQFGTSGAVAGSGVYYLSLPVAISTAMAFAIIGIVEVYDSSAGTLAVGIMTRVSSTTVQILLSTGVVVSSVVPWAWANGDVILAHFSAEAA